MEQFMQIGGVVGSLKALMVFQDSIQINQRQCGLLFDMLIQAYKVLAEEMKKNLKYEEKNTKWKVLENPLKELLRVFKEGELYIRQCIEPKDLWAKVIAFYQNTDCVEFHLHNLLCCFPIVIEAIEIAGCDLRKKRIVNSWKYKKDFFKDPRIFQWSFGHQYLINQEFCNRFRSAWDEDRLILINKIQERKPPFSSASTKHDKRFADLLLKCLNRTDNSLFPYSILIGSKDYHVKRRLGNGSQYKEIQWLGESFALRHFFGEIEPLIPEISKEMSFLSHPNIMHTFCGFTDEDKKECFLVMELMSKDLSSYIREICGPKKRVPFTLPAAVDLMLQIARGMEYLHANKIYHGDLTPSSILVKARNINTEGFLHAKVCGFGRSWSVTRNNHKSQANQNGQQILPFIWHAPEVLAEQELGSGEKYKYTEKADVYSYGMICFELLTGKVPFEDTHLQGDKMSRNIRTGERPLFPFHSSKYLTNLTRKCWQADPSQRPRFASICRILRYVKRFLVMNPDHTKQESESPLVDYTDIETALIKDSSWGDLDMVSVSQIPYEMFVYRLAEKEKSKTAAENSESGSDGDSACGDESVILDAPLPLPTEKKCNGSPEVVNKKLTKQCGWLLTGKPKGRSERPPQIRNMRTNSDGQLSSLSPKTRRTSGIVSDSELS